MAGNFLQALKDLISPDRRQQVQEDKARARLPPQPRRRRHHHRIKPVDDMHSDPPRFTVVSKPHHSSRRLLSQNFICTICFKQENGTGIECGSRSTLLCAQCFTKIVVPLFERALNNDSLRPVRVGGHDLDINDFAHTIEMPFEVIIKWRERENERSQPMAIKTYCKKMGRDLLPCSNFLCLKSKKASMVGCQACRGLMCARCGHVIGINRRSGRHLCDTSDDFEEEPKIGKLDAKKKSEGGELCEMGESDTAGTGKLTTEERKARLWEWLEGVEPFNDGRPLP
ncbi:hypothetical protein PRZ48_008971 [Zasmidium cellare]|uniref:Uncharacterized protein n=1 Tax=Zasmidium cellare TaxID=395010 RepID=A0ABR0EH07_ZASCE|nr:hypothetical protein PRZ48_008971 [Zasmidium cellare]